MFPNEVANVNGWRNWFFGVLLAIVMAGGGWAWTSTAEKIDSTQAAQSRHSERVAVLEEAQRTTKETIKEIKDDVKDVKRALERIEQKLDRPSQ